MYVVSEKIFINNLPVQVGWITVYNSREFCLIIIAVVTIDVSGYMKPVDEKEFLMFRTWRRIEVESNRAVDNSPDNCFTMRLGGEFIKLHV